MHENRATSRAPRPEGERGRYTNAQSQQADAHAPEESDPAIRSMNQAKKEERSSAEPGERRARAKENIVQLNTNPAHCGNGVSRGLRVMPLVWFCAGGRSAMIVPTATSACGISGTIDLYSGTLASRTFAICPGCSKVKALK